MERTGNATPIESDRTMHVDDNQSDGFPKATRIDKNVNLIQIESQNVNLLGFRLLSR